jgi:flavin-dependent dehydrogenase
MTPATARTWDVAVVGAGSAGSAAAYQLARAGFETLVLERRALDDAGARWVNAVPGWAFDEAGLERAPFPECRGVTSRFHLFAGWGPLGMTIEPRDILDIDMRHLVQRLRAGAIAAGATFATPARVTGFSADGALATDIGPVRARLIVDATGLRGELGGPRAAPADICAAAQAVFRVSDPAEAARFFADHGAGPHEPVCFAGIAGGFSVVVVRLEGDDEVSILTGSRPAAGHASGGQLLRTFVARERWVGPQLFGGQAPIPLAAPTKAPFHQSPAGPVIRLGDAAGHVFAAHGSGIGLQLVGGAMAAEAYRQHRDADRAARAFGDAWQRRFGLLLQASDWFRRSTQHLSPRTLHRLIKHRILVPEMMRIGLEQRIPEGFPMTLLRRR